MKMKFDRLNKDLDFNCVSRIMKENTEDSFARRTIGEKFRDVDFRSYYEEGKPLNSNNHKHIMMHRGVSVDYANDLSLLFNRYKLILNFKPQFLKYAKYLYVLKFLKGAGVVWNTPSHDNPFHRTFFKSDYFSINSISILSKHRIMDHV